jgi:tRNA A37 threonylcarbamoyladenosine synthetase subunit TsaC/SUA5/YrdC
VGSKALADLVFLTQTDTTIGFVSQNPARLDAIKQRPPHKHYIKAVPSLAVLNTFARIPKKYRTLVRRAKKTTFVLPNGHSYRVVRDKHHLLLIERLGWAYTTSANLSGHPYDEKFAKEAADVVITPLNTGSKASDIYKLNRHTIKRIR